MRRTLISILILLFATASFGQKNNSQKSFEQNKTKSYSSPEKKNSKSLSAPEKQFETFWTTFRDNYAFFQHKGINWDSTYKAYRPLINKKTSEQKLLQILGRMVDPLKDGHITISKGDDILYKGKKTSYFKTEFAGLEKEFWNNVFATLTKNGFNQPAAIGPLFRDEPLYYFSTSKDLAYIRITRCFGTMESLFDDHLEVEDIKLMLSLFDSLLNSISTSKALIIDMRSNGGGHGGFELASRFIREKAITHFKSIKQPGGYDQFSVAEPISIQQNEGVQYFKPLYILNNDKTASSAEDFSISLYRQPTVKLFGTNTSGMFSDMYEAELSETISFTLSNERYLSVDYEVLEDNGVPVSVKIVNSKQDIQNGKDPVLAAIFNEVKNLH